jgi:hypothetical protein
MNLSCPETFQESGPSGDCRLADGRANRHKGLIVDLNHKNLAGRDKIERKRERCASHGKADRRMPGRAVGNAVTPRRDCATGDRGRRQVLIVDIERS